MMERPSLTQINVKDFEYDLPRRRIALYPADKRDESKLLIYNKGIIEETIFKNLIDFIPEGSHIVFNNSRVINARLIFRKDSGAAIEVLCLEPYSPDDYGVSLSSHSGVLWKCMVGNLSKWKDGVIKTTFAFNERKVLLCAEKIKQEDSTGNIIIKFSWDMEKLSFGEVIRYAGHVPLPPYIERPDEPVDATRYQTVYSKPEGSVAAPTAGLHFTHRIEKGLSEKNIKKTEITLHVGAGTFLPVKSKNILDHEMHSEKFITEYVEIQRLTAHTGPLVAVGTTSLRALESLYIAGTRLMKNEKELNDSYIEIGQWEGYGAENNPSMKEVFGFILHAMKKKGISDLRCSTRLMIAPGFSFKTADYLITNFHQPRSTLLMLVAAWVGSDWKNIYNYALLHDFRFLSYGDSSLLVRNR